MSPFAVAFAVACPFGCHPAGICFLSLLVLLFVIPLSGMYLSQPQWLGWNVSQSATTARVPHPSQSHRDGCRTPVGWPILCSLIAKGGLFAPANRTPEPPQVRPKTPPPLQAPHPTISLWQNGSFRRPTCSVLNAANQSTHPPASAPPAEPPSQQPLRLRPAITQTPTNSPGHATTA